MDQTNTHIHTENHGEGIRTLSQQKGMLQQVGESLRLALHSFTHVQRGDCDRKGLHRRPEAFLRWWCLCSSGVPDTRGVSLLMLSHFRRCRILAKKEDDACCAASQIVF